MPSNTVFLAGFRADFLTLPFLGILDFLHVFCQFFPLVSGQVRLIALRIDVQQVNFSIHNEVVVDGSHAATLSTALTCPAGFTDTACSRYDRMLPRIVGYSQLHCRLLMT